MWRSLLARIKKKKTARFLEDIYVWHQICHEIIGLCGKALHDEDICQSDIGIVMDQADRQLFSLRSATAEARGVLRRAHPDLARHLTSFSQRVYVLRNETARFLIRCQGLGPLLSEHPPHEGEQRMYYYRALEEVGFNARQMHAEVKGEFEVLWQEVLPVIAVAEKKMGDGIH